MAVFYLSDLKYLVRDSPVNKLSFCTGLANCFVLFVFRSQESQQSKVSLVSNDSKILATLAGNGDSFVRQIRQAAVMVRLHNSNAKLATAVTVVGEFECARRIGFQSRSKENSLPSQTICRRRCMAGVK